MGRIPAASRMRPPSKLAVLALPILLLATATAIPSPPIRPAASFTLGADLSGWVGDGGVRNPTLSAASGDNLSVTITWVNSLHNWAVYPEGTAPGDVSVGSPAALARTDDVWSGSTMASVSFSLPSGAYEYFCEYHPFSMRGRLIIGAANAPPILGALSATPATAGAGEPISFQATASDPDNDALSYEWDFGDGSTATGVTAPGGGSIIATHAYASPGTYNVTLSISDSGAQRTASVSVSIAPTPGPTGLDLVLLVLSVVGVAALLAGAYALWRLRAKGRLP